MPLLCPACTAAMLQLMQTGAQLTAAQPNLNTNLLDNADMLQRFKVSRRTLLNWRNKGLLPFTRVGRKTYYPLDEVERVLAAHNSQMGQ